MKKYLRRSTWLAVGVATAQRLAKLPISPVGARSAGSQSSLSGKAQAIRMG